MTALTKVRMTIITIFLLWICSVQTSHAGPDGPQAPEVIFSKASLYYEATQYDEAIHQYRLLLQQGLESGPLFYNLGNCYLKKGQLGKALLNYERAKRLIPSDADLIANHQYARSFIKGSSSGDALAWHDKVFEGLSGRFSPDGLTISLSVIYTLFMLMLTIRIYSTRMRRYSSGVIVILFVLFILSSLSLYRKVSVIGKEAIAMTDEVDVKLQPFEKAPLHFTLYEGTKVWILRTEGDWVKILTLNKKAGWVKASHIEVI